jgi:hypothetical protein
MTTTRRSFFKRGLAALAACVGWKVLPDEEPTAEQRMRLVEQSGVLDFWKDERENIYTYKDGEPVAYTTNTTNSAQLVIRLYDADGREIPFNNSILRKWAVRVENQPPQSWFDEAIDPFQPEVIT